MRSFLRSFRGRLTLWSMGIIAVSLVSFSLVLSLYSLNRLALNIDRDLQMRARAAERAGPRGLPGQPRGQAPGAPGGGPAPAAHPPTPPPEMRLDPGMQLDFDLRRPRFIDNAGKSVGAFFDNTPFDAAAVGGALRGREIYSRVLRKDQPIRVFTMPWRGPDGTLRGVIQVARGLIDYEELKRVQTATLLTLIPLALLATAGGAFLLVGRGLRPIAEMRSAAVAVGEGDLSQRLQVRGEDELAQLASAFNEMASRLQLSFEQQRSAYAALQESYESQRRFTADASHELRTPLSRLQLATSSALSGPPEGYLPALQTADSAAQSMSKLVKQLLTLARADAGQLGLHREPLDLRLVVSNAVNSVARPIDIEVPEGPLTVEGDEDHLERCVLNLLENAIRHTPDDGEIAVKLGLVQNDVHPSQAFIEVRDSGTGIGPEHLSHIFDRFYRADASRARADGGMGLGLSICKSIVEAHQGVVEVSSEAGIGTTFKIFLPLRQSS